MKTITIGILITCLTLFATSCETDKKCCTCSVPYSDNGAGTLGCLMDGKPWAACNFAGDEVKGGVGVSIEEIESNIYLKIANHKSYNGGKDALYIQLWNPRLGLIPNRLSQAPDGTVGYVKGEFFTENSQYHGIYKQDSTEHFYLELTRFDTINRIISGRFECTLKRTGSIIDTTKIKVTEGVFDARY